MYDPVGNKSKEREPRVLFQCYSIARSVLGGVLCTEKNLKDTNDDVGFRSQKF